MSYVVGPERASKTHRALLQQILSESPPTIERASGVYLYDEAGRDYIDGSGGAMTVSIGHGVPEVLAAMHTQAQCVCFTYRTQFTNRPAEELAELLVRLAPGDLNGVLFANSGSEATELAMRASVQYWREVGRPGKTHVLGRRTSYHGMTMGALSMSGHGVRRRDYGDLLHEFNIGPTPNSWGLSAGPPGQQLPTLEDPGDWLKIIEDHGADRVAALIVEPIVGAAGGVLVPPGGHLRELRSICDQLDILLIVDEVITGFGRTGPWFACEHDAVVPDMIAVGKGLTSGYTPMAALLVRERIVAAMERGSGSAPFGHTFSGNPLSAATSLAVLRYMQRNAVLENARAQSQRLERGLSDLAVKHFCVENVRGRGMLWGFDLVDPARSRESGGAANLTADFVAVCFAAGVIVYPAGIAPRSAAIVSPPLTITADETDELLARLDAGLEKFSRRLRSAGSHGECIA